MKLAVNQRIPLEHKKERRKRNNEYEDYSE